MTTTLTRIATANARRYMIQLCKHFGHKRPTTYDDVSGSVGFDMGEAKMSAEPDALVIAASGPDASSAARVAEVMESHLKRFAFREPDLVVGWVAKA